MDQLSPASKEHVLLYSTFQGSSTHTVVGLPILPSAGQKEDTGMSGVPHRSQSHRAELGTRFQMSHAPTFTGLEDTFLIFFLKMPNPHPKTINRSQKLPKQDSYKGHFSANTIINRIQDSY